MGNITLKELAKKLNCTTATVSKALNNKPDISQATRKKIQKLANSLNYIPNDSAKSLKLRKTYAIGLVLPNILDDFFTMILDSIEKKANQRNYRIVTCISHESLNKETECINTLLGANVDGVLISLAKETQKLEQYAAIRKLITQEIPLVLFDRVIDTIPCDQIVNDNKNAAYNATKYLLDSGCKKVGLLTTFTDTTVEKYRKIGYHEAISQNNKKPVIINIENNLEFKDLFLKALKGHQLDAVVALDERSAIYAMNLAQLAGYNIPKDLAITGFTNGLLSKFSFPALSTVDQHPNEIGAIAVNKLIDRIEKISVEPFNTTLVPTSLKIRNSTR